MDAPGECRIAFPATSVLPRRALKYFLYLPRETPLAIKCSRGFPRAGTSFSRYLTPLEGLNIHAARSLAAFLSQSHLTLKGRFNRFDNYAAFALIL